MVPVSDIQPTHHRPSVGLALILGASSYLLLPRLLDGHPVVAASWYFHDSHSIPYVLDLLG